MTSWRPLVAGTVGLFLVILAFLAGQLKGGGDPALGQTRPTAIEQTTPQPQQDPGESAGSGSDPYGDPSFSGPDDTDPGGSASGSAPDVSPPTTHQS